MTTPPTPSGEPIMTSAECEAVLPNPQAMGNTPGCGCDSAGMLRSFRHGIGCPYGQRAAKIEAEKIREARRERETGMRAPEGWEGYPQPLEPPPPPGLPVEPSPEAIEAAGAAITGRGTHPYGREYARYYGPEQLARFALRAAYRVDAASNSEPENLAQAPPAQADLARAIGLAESLTTAPDDLRVEGVREIGAEIVELLRELQSPTTDAPKGTP